MPFRVCKRHRQVLLIIVMMSFTMLPVILLGLAGFHSSSVSASQDIIAYPTDLTVVQNHTDMVEFRAQVPISYNIKLSFNQSDVIDHPPSIILNKTTGSGFLKVRGIKLTSRAYLEAAACTPIGSNDTKCPLDLSNVFVRITVIGSRAVDWMVDLVGWSYFFAWSISFYPQIFLNWQRKSVIGLNFDFLCLNVIGFTSYTIYNSLLYFNEVVQHEYEVEHPRSPIPVLLNDVVFAAHALFACLVTVFQCFIYEKENQRVSRVCIVFAVVLVGSGTITGSLMGFKVITLLFFVNSLSYIKMAVTLSKYFPQAMFNYCRKSTVGWSIGNVLLDFTGGSLDILQMILQAVNVADWSAFTGNPVKFGLGLVSIVFDILFMMQHYVLYRDVDVVHSEYSGIENPEAPQSPPQNPGDYGSGSNEDSVVLRTDE